MAEYLWSLDSRYSDLGAVQIQLTGLFSRWLLVVQWELEWIGACADSGFQPAKLHACVGCGASRDLPWLPGCFAVILLPLYQVEGRLLFPGTTAAQGKGRGMLG